MFINGVRFQPLSSGPMRIYRTQGGIGPNRQMVCLFQEPGEGEAIIEGIQFALDSTKPSEIVSESAVHLSDDVGNMWISHRSPLALQQMKNGAVLDAKNMGTWPNPVLRHFELNLEGEKVSVSEHLGWGASENSDLSLALKRLRKELESDFKINPFHQDKIALIVNEMSKLWQHRQSISEFRGVIGTSGTDGQKGASRQESIGELKEQVVLLQQMHDGLERLQQIEQDGRNKRADLAKISEMLGDRLTKFKLKNLDMLVGDCWQKPLQALVRLTIQRQMVDVSKDLFKDKFQKLLNMLDSWFFRVNDQLAKQNGGSEDPLIGGGKAEFSQSSGENRDSSNTSFPSDSKKVGTLQTWFDRFAASSKVKSDADSAANSLKHTNIELKQALEKMSGQLARLRTEFETGLIEVEKWHGVQLHELRDAESDWASQGVACGFPPDFDLAQFIAFAQESAEILRLHCREEELRAVIAERQRLLETLESLVQKWRRLTNSQKNIPLKQASIIIAETKAVLCFFEDKRRRLRTMEDAAYQEVGTQQVDHWLLLQEKTQGARWNTLVSKLGIDLNGSDSTRVERCIEIAAKITHLQKIQRSSNIINRASAKSAQTIAVYHWTSPLDCNVYLDEILAAVRGDNGGWAVLNIPGASEKSLSEYGISRLVKYSDRQQAKPQPAVAENENVAGEAGLPPKVLSTLRLLRTKRPGETSNRRS